MSGWIQVLIGVMVGGLVTASIEWLKHGFEVRDEDKRRQLAKLGENQRREIEELRLFQTSVEATIDAIEHDFGEFDRNRGLNEDLTDWLPFRTYSAIREADKRAVWIVDNDLIERWRQIRQSTADLQATIEIQKRSNMMSDDAKSAVESIYQTAFTTVMQNRDQYEEFNKVMRAKYLSLRDNASLRLDEQK